MLITGYSTSSYIDYDPKWPKIKPPHPHDSSRLNFVLGLKKC